MPIAARRSVGVRLAALVAALSCVVAGCSGRVQAVDIPVQPASPQGKAFFVGPGAVWTDEVPADAPVDPRSARYLAQFEGLKAVVSLREFSVPIYVADDTTRRYTITPTASYAPPGARLDGVPIPAGAAADPAADGHLAVYDPDDQCVYEFYRAEQAGNGWSAEWVNATPADGNGIYPDGLSTRAAGFSIAAGLIWPDELRNGEINHALVFAYPFTRTGGPVAPAVRSDGQVGDASALPIGARLVLDPAVDVDALDIPTQDKTIAHALQRYGMILADTSGGFTLYAVNPQSFSADPYRAIWGEETWADISAIPFDKMRVLKLPPQQKAYSGPPIPNRCSQKPPA